MRTVVVGAGPTGLFTAINLASRGRSVLVVDRDPGPPDASAARVWNRRGVMQFHHAHTFRAPVIHTLTTEMPEVLGALTAAGAEIVRDADAAPVALLCRRLVFERVLRRHAERQPGIRLVSGHVDQMIRERGRAVGVVVHGRQVAAELIVDASGRASRLTRELRPAGECSPCGASYVSRQYRLHDKAARGPVNSPIGLSLSFDGYFAVVFLHDNRTFSITITHDGTDPRVRRLRYPGTFEAVARAIPLLSDWIDPERAAPITPVLPGGQLYNSYRSQLDDDGRLALLGLVSVGDSVCTTTPLAGRGVALGFLAARELTRLLTTYPGDVESATLAFDAWCTARIRPWFDDHVRSDADRMRRWAGGGIDLSRPLPSDLVVAAAHADARLAPLAEPYDSMRALPGSLASLQQPARVMYESGWRPSTPAGPTLAQLGELCVEPDTAQSWDLTHA